MSDLKSIVQPIRGQLENAIKKETSGPFNLPKKLIYDHVMPLRVNVTTSAESCYFEMLQGGKVQLHQGSDASPDVTIRTDLAVLKELLLNQSRRLFEDAEKHEKIAVTADTWKGEQAVSQVRQLFSKAP